MKTILLAGAAVGALTFGAHAADVAAYNPITAPPASQQVSGDLALYGGFFSTNSDDSKSSTDSGSLIGGLARVNVWLAPGISSQFDLLGEHYNYSGGYGPTVVDIAGHLSWRDPGKLLGVFGSIGSAFDARTGTIGVEGQTYMGPLLLYGQAGYTTTLNSGDDIGGWYIHGEARYFINPNLLFSGNIGFASLDEDFADDNLTLIRWGLELETKFNGPFGAFVTYKGAHGSVDDFSATTHAFLVGLKIHLNNATLQSRDQAGATLKDFNPLTGVNNITGTSFSFN
jgi:hypothetical protein